MSGNDIGLWFRSIPVITRYWFVGSIILPLSGRFGIVRYPTMILDYSFISRFHVSSHYILNIFFPVVSDSDYTFFATGNIFIEDLISVVVTVSVY